MNFRETSAYQIFLHQLGELRPKIESINDFDRKNEDVRLFLHALKGNAGLFGFNELGLLAQELSALADPHPKEQFTTIKAELLNAIATILKNEVGH